MVVLKCSCGSKKLATKNPPVCRLCYGRKWEAKNRRKAKALVQCLECKKLFGRINLGHILRCHEMTTEQYRQKYPSVKTSFEKIGTQNWSHGD